MHCRSCEILVEEKLKEIPDIKNVQINYRKKQALIYSHHPLSDSEISRKIEEAGYAVGIDDSKSWISLNGRDYKDLIISGIVLLILYFLGKEFGLFNLSINTKNPSGLFFVILIGITAGFSTCMALVGGLILGISAKHAEKHPEATPTQKFRPHLYFNLGRIASYLLLGGVIGLIGKAFQLSGVTLGIITIIVGIVMITVGLQLTELFPRLSNVSFTLPSGIGKLLGIKKREQKEYSHANSMLVGALTFFLPCGFTQAMQLYAMSTGSFLSGALIMGAFALGTAPGLLSIGGITSLVKGAFARRFFKTAGVLVVVLAIINISNGFNLAGFRIKLPARSTAQNNSDNSAVPIKDGYQIVEMTQKSNGYTPNSFTIKKGIPVKWIITSEDSNSCAASIYSQKLNIRQFLNKGENVINFTPTETGKIAFSCSMGMYRGQFTVIENSDTSEKPAEATQSSAEPTPSKSPAVGSETTTPTATVDEQVIKTTYSIEGDISPKQFSVIAGKPVRFEIYSNDDGYGCMSSITLPGLVKNFEYLKKGETVTFRFTPDNGTYDITCAMGSKRGLIEAKS